MANSKEKYDGFLIKMSDEEAKLLPGSEVEIDPDEDLSKAWAEAEPAGFKLEYRKSDVFSLRLTDELYDEVIRQAVKRGIKPSVYARQLIEQGLSQDEEASLQMLATAVNNMVKKLPSETKSRKQSKKKAS